MLTTHTIAMLLLNALWCVGLNVASTIEYNTNNAMQITRKSLRIAHVDKSNSMLLWWLRFAAIKLVGNYWSKPLIACATCMASVHGIAWYLVLCNTAAQPAYEVAVQCAVYVVCLAGLNTLLIKHAY